MPTKQNAEQDFGPYPFKWPDAKLTVVPNGGLVTVSVLMNSDPEEYAVIQTIDAQETHSIEIGGLAVRITPSGGAEYSFEAAHL